MSTLSIARLAILWFVIGASGYRYGPQDWLARQQPWEWAMAGSLLLILVALTAIRRVRQATVLLAIAWLLSGMLSTAGFLWLSWRTWMHPSDGNRGAIPVIGALAFYAGFVFWYPVLNLFSKKSRLVNRVEAALEEGDPDAERYLVEARQAVGVHDQLEQAHLDQLEGRLRCTQGRLAEAQGALWRAIDQAISKDDRPLACDTAGVLIPLLHALSNQREAAALLTDLEETWGPLPELRSQLHFSGSRVGR